MPPQLRHDSLQGGSFKVCVDPFSAILSQWSKAANYSSPSFALVPLTIDLNGKETLVAHGAAVLRRQAEVDAEFATACAMGHGAVYLTHVGHNPVDAESVRVR